MLLSGLITALGWFGPPAAAETAQSFPANLVKFVVPQTPGGATDVFARKIGQILSEQWGQPIVIENRVGAGGV
jgi:tripartite-type tricarboxylate transporter receptor subunit TctC